MAYIDKIYVNTYSNYLKFIIWATNKIYECPNGMIINVYDYCYKYLNEEDFTGKPLPIANTPQSLDYFLIKNCPFDFIQDNLKRMYSKEYYNSIKDSTSNYDTFSKARKIGTKVILKRIGKYSNKNYVWPRKIKGKKCWKCCTINIQNMRFNSKEKIWLWPDELGITNSNCAYTSNSIKSAVRHLLKWKLPIGATGIILGNYQGEYWEFIIK